MNYNTIPYLPPQTLTENQKYFYDVYLSMLERAVTEYPDDYHYIAARIPEVAHLMIDALIAGTANKDSHAIRWTCKHIGIKHTYQAIKEYLHAS